MTGKILFCATIDYHFISFHLPFMRWFQEQGWEVHVAANGDLELPYVNKKYNIPIQRSPLNIKNVKAFNELKAIIDNNNYGIIHCHTPMGGMLARVASLRARKNGAKVIYTAHGFHFCQDSPCLNWIIYYPVERTLARGTDCLITINQEDYTRAVSHGFKAGTIACVHGVGVDTERFRPSETENKIELRQKNGYKPEDFLMVYVAEFNKNKNQQFLIRVLAKLTKTVPNVRLLLAGNGSRLDYCRRLAKELDISERVEFLGFRKDIEQILPMCDLAVASSFREGLPVNIMEAMACGLPVVATNNRGHKELICNGESGWLIDSKDIDKMAARIEMIARDRVLQNKFGNFGREIVEGKYAIKKILNEMSAIYGNFML